MNEYSHSESTFPKLRSLRKIKVCSLWLPPKKNKENSAIRSQKRRMISLRLSGWYSYSLFIAGRQASSPFGCPHRPANPSDKPVFFILPTFTHILCKGISPWDYHRNTHSACSNTISQYNFPYSFAMFPELVTLCAIRCRSITLNLHSSPRRSSRMKVCQMYRSGREMFSSWTCRTSFAMAVTIFSRCERSRLGHFCTTKSSIDIYVSSSVIRKDILSKPDTVRSPRQTGLYVSIPFSSNVLAFFPL